MRRLIAAGGCAAWAFAALLLAGCFAEDRTAGGDDFPNSVETLGKEGAREGSDSTEWNEYDEAPSTPPEAYDSTDAPDAPPETSSSLSRPALAALNADGRVLPGHDILGAVRLVTLAADTGDVFRAVRLQTLLGIEARDTTWYRVEALLPRVLRVSGAVTYGSAFSARTERFHFEDADGNGLLSATAGSANLARVRLAVEYASGRIEERTLILGAGADLSFRNRGDNILRSVETVHRLGADTLYHLSLRAAGGDSAVRDPARDSVRVDVEQTVAAAGVRSALFYRAVVHADSARNRAVRYRSVVTAAAGVTETVALGRDSLPDFAPGDTGRVRIVFTSSVSSDTVASSVSDYRVVLSDTAGNPGGNRLLRVDREKTFRFGAATGLRYRLYPAAPVPGGSFARDGGVELRVDLRAGGWVGFAGTVSATGSSGTWTNSLGEGGTVHFDAGGNIVTAPAP